MSIAKEIDVAVFIQIGSYEPGHEAGGGRTAGRGQRREAAGTVVVVEQNGDGVSDRIDAESSLVPDGEIGRAVVVEISRDDGHGRDKTADRRQGRERASAASESHGDAVRKLLGSREISRAVIVEIPDGNRRRPGAASQNRRRGIGDRSEEGNSRK